MERIIEIKSLSCMVYLGVPEEEQSIAQKICCDLRFVAMSQPENLNDDISLTIDYAMVSKRLQEVVQDRPRRLLETLADEVTHLLLHEFQLRWVELTIRKFILPQTEYVAVTRRREQ